MLKLRPVLKMPSPSSSYKHSNHPPVFDLPTEIIPRLYISDIYSAENTHTLDSLGITHVLSAMCGTVVIPHNTPNGTHIQHCKIPLVDTPFSELAGFLPTSTSFVREALRDENARVLVHCVKGVSRSASVIAAFLIAEFGWTPERAVGFVKAKRGVAEPNSGFVKQLGEYAALCANGSDHP